MKIRFVLMWSFILVLTGVVFSASTGPTCCVSATRCGAHTCVPWDGLYPGGGREVNPGDPTQTGWHTRTVISTWLCGQNADPGANTKCAMSGPPEICGTDTYWSGGTGCTGTPVSTTPHMTTDSCSMLEGEWGC
jgi:hypothetical protein